MLVVHYVMFIRVLLRGGVTSYLHTLSNTFNITLLRDKRTANLQACDRQAI